jgi:hypothetical protein
LIQPSGGKEKRTPKATTEVAAASPSLIHFGFCLRVPLGLTHAPTAHENYVYRDRIVLPWTEKKTFKYTPTHEPFHLQPQTDETDTFIMQ